MTANGAGFNDLTGHQYACFVFTARLEGALVEDIVATRCHTGIWIAGGFASGTIRGFEIDALPAGYLGTFDLGVEPLPECDLTIDDRWLVAQGTDGTCAGGEGGISTRCACRGGSWSLHTPTARPGIRVDRSDGLLLEDGLVENVDGHAGVVFSASGDHDALVRNIEFAQPRLGDGLLRPMTYGVRDPLHDGSITASGILCEPGAVSEACVDI